jgi:hypothetical protein
VRRLSAVTVGGLICDMVTRMLLGVITLYLLAAIASTLAETAGLGGGAAANPSACVSVPVSGCPGG